MMLVRVATASDIPELAQLYAQSVRAIAPQHYSQEQVDAWASFPTTQVDQFQQFILEPTTFVMQDDNTILGFAGIAEDGHITSVYVRGDRSREGLGSKLLEVVLQFAQIHNIEQLYAEASEFSKPLFEKFGFETYGIEKVIREGIPFERYLVRRTQFD